MCKKGSVINDSNDSHLSPTPFILYNGHLSTGSRVKSGLAAPYWTKSSTKCLFFAVIIAISLDITGDIREKRSVIIVWLTDDHTSKNS